MSAILKLEELGMLLLSALLLWNSDAAWFWYLLLLLGPDVSMLGYLINNNVGAFMYNLFHHKGVAVVIFIGGVYFNNIWMQQIGMVLFGHASLDRLFGYGLKYRKGFAFTHLGIIGKNKLRENESE
ncbi:DUF4260 domain-containing protein [Niabella insulamsoli]|uniref:DUF4260 domain-containing protein n=1 Tax=Niabella insulamsoli TaxID=3144874 RepID=UPI0031FBE43A